MKTGNHNKKILDLESTWSSLPQKLKVEIKNSLLKSNELSSTECKMLV